MKTILIAEDDPDILELLNLYLESNHYQVLNARNGIEAFEIFHKEEIQVLIVDIMMPEMNGYELIKKVRRESNVPIIILSAKNQDTDKVLGLNLGADAYITKPFNPLEVIAYIEAVSRRYTKEEQKEIKEDLIIKEGDLTLLLDRYLLKKKEKTVPLTSTEFKILAKLMKSPGRIFTKSQLYECINGELYENDENTMMVHISNLRSKIEEDPSNPKYIITVRGLGYKFENTKK